MLDKIQLELSNRQHLVLLDDQQQGLYLPQMALKDRFKQAREAAGLRQHELERLTGISQQSLSKIERGDTKRTRHLVAIANALGVRPEWLETGDGPMRSGGATPEEGAPMAEPGPALYLQPRKVPIVGTARMGPEKHYCELEYPTGHGDGWVEIPVQDDQAYALRVRGDSMSPAIRDGWVVVCEPDKPLVPGEYVLVVTNAGQVMVKELLFERDDTLHLMSVNETYGRCSVARSELEKAHYVGFVVPPSKIRL